MVSREIVEQVSELLKNTAVVSVVGFRGSGKSFVADALRERLTNNTNVVLLQNAKLWLGTMAGEPKSSENAPSVDPEIVGALSKFSGTDKRSIWIVDDAEIMLAYTAEQLLQTIGIRLRLGLFSAILIRNHFVNEGDGWFQSRLNLISPAIPALKMQPLPREETLSIAIGRFNEFSRMQQGEWLAEMSGGIPGLIDELYPFTPKWGSLSSSTRVDQLAATWKQQIGLDQPFLQSTALALCQEVLPPFPFLSPTGRAALGVLMMSGAVPLDYQWGDVPLNGRFWSLVIGIVPAPAPIQPAWQEIGIKFELMIEELELSDISLEEFGIPQGSLCGLAHGIAAAFYCRMYFPELIRPLADVLADVLGRHGLRSMLRSCEVSIPVGSTTIEMAILLVEELGRV